MTELLVNTFNIKDIFIKHNIIQAKVNIDKNNILIAFDYGTKRIGVAGGNLIINQAFAINILHYETRIQRFKALELIIRQWQPNYIIIGLPIHADGSTHDLTRASCNFGLDINRYFTLPIIWVDERYTTLAQHKKFKQYVDDKSAMLIMQQFIDNYNNEYFILK